MCRHPASVSLHISLHHRELVVQWSRIQTSTQRVTDRDAENSQNGNRAHTKIYYIRSGLAVCHIFPLDIEHWWFRGIKYINIRSSLAVS